LTKDGELSEQTNLMLMMKDPFANYVVQKMVEVIEPERKKFLVFKIRQYLKLIQKNTHGKHLASIEKLTHICRAYD
jgi:mRNA-binding protein PUF3